MATADRHLLFGLLALQTGIINQGQLVAAFQAWTLDKTRSLAEHLEARGDLNSAKRTVLDALAAVHLETNGGNVEQSLAAVPSSRSTRASLATLGEPDIEATLARISESKNGQTTNPNADDDVADRTANYSVGTATSHGQRFRILRPHARGGLGAVFVALDGELHREVALKQILETHAHDPVSRKRFVAEAEITGGLEHPGVVPVYGLGTDAGGRPYYAMRLVKGDSLKEAIDAFHQRPHRDPPSPDRGEGARRAGEGAAGAPRQREGARRQSPLICPASADLRPSDIFSPRGEGAREGAGGTIASRDLALRKLLRRFLDVCNAVDYAHSRGVIHRDLKPANIIVGKHGETLVVDWGLAKAVSRADPAVGEQTLAPSSSGSAETLPGSALGTPAYMSPEQARGELNSLGPRSDVYSLGATLYCLLTGKQPFEGDDVGVILRAAEKGQFQRPSQRDPSLDRALEAVCLKAMATQPEDRYATPKALADDLERWMADEPVTAWREPISRQTRRWARRNRTAVTALAASVLVALAGTAAVLAVQTRANVDLKSANLDLAIANDRVTQANNDLKSANQREQQRFGLAMDAIKLFHGDVSEDLLLKERQFEGLRTKLLKGAADFYGRLEGLLKGQTDRESRTALGKAYYELGELTGNIGDQTAALAVHRKALAVRRALASAPRANAGTKLDVAASLNAAGLLQASTGDMAGARASYEEARRLAEEAEAEGGAAEQPQEVMGRAHYRIARVLAETGNASGALAAYKEALVIQQTLADANPSVPRFQQYLATTHNTLGYLLSSLGDPARARAAYDEALAIRQKLAGANPSVTAFQRDLAWSHYCIGMLLSAMGDRTAARAASASALAIRQKLAAANANVTPLQSELANSHLDVGWLLVRSGKPGESIDHFSREEAIWKTLADANPTVREYRNSLANCQTNTAAVLLRLGRPAEARARCERAVALREVLVSADPNVPEYRRGLAESLLRFGQVRRAERDLVGASADWRRSVALFKSVSALNAEYVFFYAGCHASLSSLAGQPGTGVSAGARDAEAERAMALLRQAVGMGYRDPLTYRTETALDPLRARPDFRLLLLDLAMPADPFAFPR